MKQILFAVVIGCILTSCSTDPLVQADDLKSFERSHCEIPCMGEAEINIADLPSSISDYIVANYAAEMVEDAEVLGCDIAEVENENEQEGENENEHEDLFSGAAEDIEYYVVELESGTELLFNADGSFVVEELNSDEDGDDSDENDDSDEGDDNDSDENELAIDALPSTVVDYVNANYSAFTIDEAASEITFGYAYIEVELEDEVADTEVSVMFDMEGNFLCESEED